MRKYVVLPSLNWNHLSVTGLSEVRWVYVDYIGMISLDIHTRFYVLLKDFSI